MKYDVTYHKPILVDKIREYLNINPNGIYLDGTLGGGGHSEMILDNLSDSGKLISLDKDDDALAFASKRLEKFGSKFQAVKSDYLYADEVLNELDIPLLDGALLDLGVSSHQLDDFERGFSYRADDAPLDMRMDKTQSFSAYDIVNGYSFQEMRDIFYKYGEEKFSPKIASAIEKARLEKPIQTCGQLVDIIKKAVPFYQKKEGHPAKRVFQAIRIEVNGELKDLEEAVQKLTRRLKPQGRICVLTFHSLEDRIIKNLFKEMELDCICPKNFPVCVCDKVQEIKIITKKPITADQEEIMSNSRSASAKLRVAEKV